MNLSPEQSQAIDYCINFFDEKIKWMNAECIVLYGSATYPGCFVKKMSDLDILVFTKDATAAKMPKIVQNISMAMPSEMSLKRPSIIQDHIGNRIEFELPYKDMSIDCTIMECLTPNEETMLSNAVRDSTELLIGAIIIWGKTIRGEINDYISQYINLFPYYDNHIRNRRLKIIEQYLFSKIARIDFMLDINDSAVIDYFFRYRPIFLKWIFCYYRTYPINFYKHLPLQLSWIKELSQEETSIILLNQDGNIVSNIRTFINFFKLLLDNFNTANE